MIIKFCARCQKKIEYPNTYCSRCKKEYETEKEKYKKIRNKRYNTKRDKKYIRFYNSKQWIVLRNKKLQDTKYRCEECNELGTEVHHIVPIQTEDGWIKRLEYNNLKTVCVRCHNKFHNRF